MEIDLALLEQIINWVLKGIGIIWLIIQGFNKFEEVFKITDFINKPRLTIEDAEIYRAYIDGGVILDGNFLRAERVIFSWRVLNHKKWFLGQDVNNMVTKWTLYYLNEDGSMRMIDTLGEKPVSLLPKDGECVQKVPRSDEFPSGVYRLHLSILSNDKPLKSYSTELTLVDEFRD